MGFTVQNRRVVGRAIAGLLLVSSLVLFSGCGLLPKGGQTAAEATKQLAALPVTKKAQVYVEGNYNGLKKVNYVVVHFEVEDGYRIAADEPLVDFLIRTAWSVNNVKPNEFLAIYVTVQAGQTVDAFAAARDAGWKGIFGKDAADPGHFQLDIGAANKKLGDWPGKVPSLPEDVIVPAS